MPYCYQRYSLLEGRFSRIVRLIETKRMNTSTLAKELGVSRQTVIRMVNLLRRRGYKINVVRDVEGWRYEIMYKPQFIPIPRSTGKANQNQDQQAPSNSQPEMPTST